VGSLFIKMLKSSLKPAEDGLELFQGVKQYISFYNREGGINLLVYKRLQNVIHNWRHDQKKKQAKKKRCGNMENSEGSLPHSHTMVVITIVYLINMVELLS
jgi:hypothetical protein